MKRLLLAFVLLCTTLTAVAQTTAVSAIVQDPHSQPYANGNFRVTFHPNGFPAETYRLNGSTFTQVFTGPLDANGAFNVTVGDNSIIAPSGSQWDFQVCPNASSPCTTVTLTISGSSQNVSNLINGALPPIAVTIQPQPNATALAKAYNDTEIQSPVSGAMYFNLTDSCLHAFGGATWGTACGGGGGGVPTTLPNCTATGTVQFEGVQFSVQNVGGNNQVCGQVSPTSTLTAIAVCTVNCGNTGSAQLVYTGLAPTLLDNQGVAQDYVVPSATNPGQFTDIGAIKPPATVETFGIVTQVNTGGGTTAQVYVQPLSLYAPGSNTNAGNINPAAQFVIPIYSQAGSNNILSGSLCTEDLAGNGICNSLTTNGIGTGTITYTEGVPPAFPGSNQGTTYIDSNIQQQSCYQAGGISCGPVYTAVGLKCDGSTNDTTAFSAILTAIGSGVGTIQFPPNRKCVIGTVTVPTNVMLDFTPGSSLSGLASNIVTIKGGVNNPDNHQIFFNANSGTTGTIDFTGNTQIKDVYPEWWGASPTASVATNTIALQNAIYGAFGCGPVIACRTNGSGNFKWNKTLKLMQNYQINGQLNMYHVINFRVDCNGRLNAGITQTASNTEAIDGQSVAYGVFNDCSWASSASQDLSHPIMSLDYNTSQGTDLATQFIDFYNNNWNGSAVTKLGFQLSRSGGGAQGSNVHFFDNAAVNFTEAAYMIGAGSGGVNSLSANNAIEIQWIGGDVQSCPAYGIESFGGGNLLVQGTSFEDGFTSQTGYDVWVGTEPAGEWSNINNVRSESRRMFGSDSDLSVNNVVIVDQAVAFTPGGNPAVGTVIEGSTYGGDGVWYKVSVQGVLGGLGTINTPRTASSGGATSITDSVGGLTVNAFVGYQATIITGSGVYQYCVITSNTASVITCSGGWLTHFSSVTGGNRTVTITNPDNTSLFIIEPHWGSQFTSGGATWTTTGEKWSEAFLMANNIFVPGEQITFDYRSKLSNSKFTRADWGDSGVASGAFSPSSTANYQNILVIDQNNTNMSYRSWGLPHPDIFTGITGFSLDFKGAVPICWGDGVVTPSVVTKDDICVGINGTGNFNITNNSSGSPFTSGFGKDGANFGPEISTPGSNPASGNEKSYFKAGLGLCSLDSSGIERCGGAGANLGAWYVQRASCGSLSNCTQVKADGRYVIDATSNSSTTITCPNSDCNFTQADVGKTVWATTQGSGAGIGFLIYTTYVCPVTTILTVNSAQSITVGTTCTANGTANVALYWATDDGTALAALDAAVGCSVVYLPDGGIPGNYMLTSQPFLVTAPTTATCNQNITTSVGAPGPALVGTGFGASQSTIMISPSFVWANCKAISGASENVCLGGTARTIANLQVLGSGLTSASNSAGCSGAASKILVSASPISSTMYGVDVAGVCPGASSMIGVELNSSDENFDLGGAQEVGSNACNVHSPAKGVGIRESDCHNANVSGGVGLNIENGAQAADLSSYVMAGVNINGQFNTRGTHLEARGGGGTAVAVGSAGVWISYGDFVGDVTAVGTTATGISVTAGGSVQIANTPITATGPSIANAGTVTNLGGTKLGALPNGAGKWLGAGVLTGSCRGTATSSATLGLYVMGENTTANCTSTTVNLGLIVPAVPLSGSIFMLSVSAGTGCKSGNTCVFTVLKNGGATTLTCSMVGPASTCQDTTHFDIPVAGDTYSIQFTTGATETLANVTATLLDF